LKDYWFLNAAIALGTGSVLGLLISPGATPAIGCACALTSVGSLWAVKRIEKNRLDRAGKSLHARIHHLNLRAQNIQENVLLAEDQRTRLQMEIAHHQNQVMALESARKRIAGETATIEAQLLALQVEKKLLEASLEQPTATKAINTLKQNNRTKDRVAAQQESLATLATEIGERSLEHQQLTTTIEKLVTDQNAATAKCQELKNQEKQLEQSLQHLQAQVTQQSILQTQVTELHQEREQLQESIDWLRTDRDQIIAQSQSHLQELLEKEQTIQQSVKELEQEAMKYEQNQTRMDTLYKEWQQLEDSMKQLTEQKVAKETSLAKIQPLIQTLEQTREQLMAEVTELRAQKTRLDQATEQSENQSIEQSSTANPLFSDLTPWQEKFEDEKIRAVFEHLHEYGSLTEAELTQMLEGNPRKARQFALKFDEYLMYVPFAARVEVGAAGKRYVRN
jgi:chromosome segregation ATPase